MSKGLLEVKESDFKFKRTKINTDLYEILHVICAAPANQGDAQINDIFLMLLPLFINQMNSS